MTRKGREFINKKIMEKDYFFVIPMLLAVGVDLSALPMVNAGNFGETSLHFLLVFFLLLTSRLV